MQFRIDKGTGYNYCYSPESIYANNAGKVMEHSYVVCKHIGRKLEANECVHHIDRNRTNNSIENLQLMTMSDHTLLHAIEDRGYVAEKRQCLSCSSRFLVSTTSGQKYCKSSCASGAREKFDISKEDLLFLVWSIPTVEVARILGVSDVAVSKRCKRYNIEKPPRGYWAKVHSGKILAKQPKNYI